MSPMLSRREFFARTAVSASVVLGAGTLSWANSPQLLANSVDINDLPTPALLIDLDAFESNLAKMAEHAKAKGIGLRPHAKTHKCPIIAKKQIEAGALGICCAKVSEAEVMADAGIENILITSPVATKDKIDRVIALANRCTGFQMVVDNQTSARDFASAANAAKTKLRVLIDLDSGSRRTGIQPGEAAIALAQSIAKLPSLQFDGLQAYSGHVMHVDGFEARKQRSIESLASSLETKTAIEKGGIEVGVFTGGGTGTYDIDCDIAGITDLQVGSYIFMDVQYIVIGDPDSPRFDTFAPSLFVLATAISQPVEGSITIDAGFKAFANEPNAKPEFRNHPDLAYSYGGDEHGIVRFNGDTGTLKLGEKAELIVSHCDPTVNLYDWYYPYRDGVVEERWPIAARGKSQ